MFSSTRQKLIEDNHPYWTAKEIAKRLAGQQIQQELKNQNEKASGKLIPEAFLVGYIAKTT